jgi:hypothetical protein
VDDEILCFHCIIPAIIRPSYLPNTPSVFVIQAYLSRTKSLFPLIHPIYQIYHPPTTPIVFLLPRVIYWTWLRNKKRIGRSAALGWPTTQASPDEQSHSSLKSGMGTGTQRNPLVPSITWILRYLRMVSVTGRLTLIWGPLTCKSCPSLT